MNKPFAEMNESERHAYRSGQQSVIDEFLAIVADLEESRNGNSSYGKGQLFILRELVRRMCD